MGKQFKFIKPIIKIDEDKLASLGYNDIFGIKFFDKPIPKELNQVQVGFQVITEDYRLINSDKGLEYKPTEHEESLWERYKENSYELSKEVIGSLHCPFTDKKLRDIYFGGAKRSSKRYNYETVDKTNGVGKHWIGGSWQVIDPRKVKLGTSLSSWYDETVLQVMSDEWRFGEDTNLLDVTMPDLTVLSDSLDSVNVWYSSRNYQGVERLTTYVSINGRYFKNRGKRNVYLDSPYIEDFEAKVNAKEEGL